MFFIGLLQPLGAIMPLADAQSEWVSDYLAGRYALPAPAAMRADIERERERMFKRYVRVEAAHDAGRLRRLPRRPREGAQARRRARAGAGHALPVPPRRGGGRSRMSAPAAGRREQTKAANRAAILAAARDVFAEDGYDAAGVRDIIRRTDLASGTFYNYFPDKEAIFRALVEETGAEARRRVRAARRRAAHAEEFVEGGYRAYFEYIVEDPERFAFMRRNLDTLRTRFGDAVLPAGTDELAEDLRAGDRAPGSCRRSTSSYCAHAMIAVGLELGMRLVERTPPDVEGATRFASALFLGALEAAR